MLEDLSLDILSGVACMSSFHFHRVFSAITGERVMDYVKRRRLTHASFQLLDTDKTINQIALNHKYDTHEAFTRAFKKVFNITPHLYRENNREIIGSIKCPISPERVFQDLNYSIKCMNECNFVGFGKDIDANDDDKEFIEQSKLSSMLIDFISKNSSLSEIDYIYKIYTYLQYEGDDPSRYNVFFGVISETSIDISEEVKCIQLPARHYITYHHFGGIDKFYDSYETLYEKILPVIDVEPDYSYTLEVIHASQLQFELDNPSKVPIFDSSFEFDICIPLKK